MVTGLLFIWDPCRDDVETIDNNSGGRDRIEDDNKRVGVSEEVFEPCTGGLAICRDIVFCVQYHMMGPNCGHYAEGLVLMYLM